jgi:SagB-type dehydrogenase family enzyme
MTKNFNIFHSSSIVQTLSSQLKYDIERFHDKTKYEVSIFDDKEILSNSVNSNDFLRQVERSAIDISCDLDLPSFQLEHKAEALRKETIRHFDNKPVSIDVLKTLISSLLLSEKSHRREYPSAGGLYPIESFISISSIGISDLPDNLDDGIYYVNPIKSRLELVKKISDTEIPEILGIKNYNFSNVCFSSIYMLNINKNLFKYGYRGYRHALIEVGIISQLMRSGSSKLDLYCCESADFEDNYLSKKIGVNEEYLKPILIQHFGEKNEKIFNCI